MTEAQKKLLSLLSKSLFNNTLDVSNISDWDELFKEARYQAVDLLVYDSVNPSVIPDTLKTSAASILTSNIRVLYNHNSVHEWMTDAGIPYVILKGFSSAFYYPRPELRVMGDVDFLVQKEYLKKACEVLEEKGLKRNDEDHPSHMVFRKSGMHLEVHFNVAGIPYGECGTIINQYFDTIFADASLKQINIYDAVIPSTFHHGLILLLHTIHHMTGEGIGLRHLCDWAVFENSISNDDFKTIFEERLREVGLWKFAQIITRVSIKYLGAKERDWACADDAVVDRFIEDIIEGGNFGRKDKDRSKQAVLISSRGKNGVGQTSTFKQLIVSMNNVLYTKWPASKKIKILLPFGWIYLIVKRIILVIFRKREYTDPVQLIHAAESRKDIYKKMHLFERN